MCTGTAVWVNSSAAACKTTTCVTNISRTFFTGNRAGTAGALFLMAPMVQYNISHSKFVANVAGNGSAGALYYHCHSLLASSNNSAFQSSLGISNTEFVRNEATVANGRCDGGAVSAKLNGTSMRLESCLFEENSAVASTKNSSATGGGLHVWRDSTHATNNGGSYSVDRGEEFTLE